MIGLQILLIAGQQIAALPGFGILHVRQQQVDGDDDIVRLHDALVAGSEQLGGINSDHRAQYEDDEGDCQAEGNCRIEAKCALVVHARVFSVHLTHALSISASTHQALLRSREKGAV